MIFNSTWLTIFWFQLINFLIKFFKWKREKFMPWKMYAFFKMMNSDNKFHFKNYSLLVVVKMLKQSVFTWQWKSCGGKLVILLEDKIKVSMHLSTLKTILGTSVKPQWLRSILVTNILSSCWLWQQDSIPPILLYH